MLTAQKESLEGNSGGGVYSLPCTWPPNSDLIPEGQIPLGKIKALRLRAPNS